MKPVAASALCGLVLLAAVPVVAQPEARTEVSVITGTVVAAQGQQPLADVVVTAVSPVLHEARTAVTDARGNYRIPELPPGEYTVWFEKAAFRKAARVDVLLLPKRSLRVNAVMRPEAVAPTVEVQPGHVQSHVDEEFLRRIAAARGGCEAEAHGVSINEVKVPDGGPVDAGP